MQFTDVVALVTEVYNVYKEAEADGTLAKLEAAAVAIEGELGTSNLQGLLAKLKTLFATKV